MSQPFDQEPREGFVDDGSLQDQPSEGGSDEQATPELDTPGAREERSAFDLYGGIAVRGGGVGKPMLPPLSHIEGGPDDGIIQGGSEYWRSLKRTHGIGQNNVKPLVSLYELLSRKGSNINLFNEAPGDGGPISQGDRTETDRGQAPAPTEGGTQPDPGLSGYLAGLLDDIRWPEPGPLLDDRISLTDPGLTRYNPRPREEGLYIKPQTTGGAYGELIRRIRDGFTTDPTIHSGRIIWHDDGYDPYNDANRLRLRGLFGLKDPTDTISEQPIIEPEPEE